MREEVVEGFNRGGERGARVVVESVKAGLKDGGALGAHGGELVAAGVGQRDPRRAGVERIGRPGHQPVLLEPAHDPGHRRLRHQLSGGQVGDPERALVVEPPERQQRRHAAATAHAGAQELREAGDPAVELGRELRGLGRLHSNTI